MELVIVRLSTETMHGQVDIARQQIARLAMEGIPWQGYIWVYYDQQPRAAIEEISRLYDDLWGGYAGARIWLDDEDEAVQMPIVGGWLGDAALALLDEGFEPAVYTRSGLWNGSQRRGLPLMPEVLGGLRVWAATGSHIIDEIPPVLDWLGPTVGVQYLAREALCPLLGAHDANWFYDLGIDPD